MRKVALSQDGVAGVGTFLQPSAGPWRVLAGLQFHGIEPGSAATTTTQRLTVLGWAFSFSEAPLHAGERAVLRVLRRPREGAE